MGVPERDHEKKLKILVVDDEPNILDVARSYLESEGYDVVTADSGASLMSAIEEDEPNIVLLDIRMPDIDGLQCLRQIKSISPDTEVIMMSGFATRQMAQKALELGAFDYLGKPLSFSHLIQVIEQIRITKFLEPM